MAGRAAKFLEFVNEARSPFHAVDQAAGILSRAGFTRISEKEAWNLKPNNSYFFTRNQSSIVAFSIGGKFHPSHGYTVVGAHTDSPNLKVKPISRAGAHGYLQVGVEPYGGGLWHTWFDRDLALAGRVYIRRGESLVSQLVSIKRPLLRIPTLAIHLDREVNDALKFNKQEHFLPVLATAVEGELNQKSGQHHSVLLECLAEELKCSPGDITTFDLSVCDNAVGTLGGARNEFIFSARLDNLMMSFCSLSGLVESLPSLEGETGVRMVFLFDHEEIGSQSAYGADSTLASEAIARISTAFGGSSEDLQVAYRRSFVISADMAHGVHPNYSGKHEENHRPSLGKGPVLKWNANQRYATTAETGAVILELGRRNNIPVQQFLVRNDSACGTTIGPMLSAKTGIRTVDIGNPQLSMHSIREMAHVADVDYAVELLSSFFTQFPSLDATFSHE